MNLVPFRFILCSTYFYFFCRSDTRFDPFANVKGIAYFEYRCFRI